jgi:hypothetical protein
VIASETISKYIVLTQAMAFFLQAKENKKVSALGIDWTGGLSPDYRGYSYLSTGQTHFTGVPTANTIAACRFRSSNSKYRHSL